MRLQQARLVAMVAQSRVGQVLLVMRQQLWQSA
jgi:hypothetical protein